jgi:hypothetical protein
VALRELFRRHWPALAAVAALLAAALAFLRSDSASPSVATTSPAPGKVRQAAFAVGPDGTSYAAWTRDSGGVPRLEVAVGPGADLAEPVPIELADGVIDPRIAAGRDSALVAFRTGETGTRVMALRVSRDGAVAGPSIVSANPAGGQFLEPAAADDGGGAVAWTEGVERLDASGVSAGTRHRLLAAPVGPRSAAGTERLMSEDAGAGFASLAVAPDGRIALAWASTGREVRVGQRLGGPMYVVEAPPGGYFGTPVAVPGPAGGAALGDSISAAYTRSGVLRAAWVEQEGAGTAARYTGVTAIRSGLGFENRLVLSRNPLLYAASIVPVAEGELVAFGRAGEDAYEPEAEAWLDVAGVSGGRVLARHALASDGTTAGDHRVAPILKPAGAGALAVWSGDNRIAYAVCSLTEGCGDPREVARVDSPDRLQLVGAGASALAWLEGRGPIEFDLRVGGF